MERDHSRFENQCRRFHFNSHAHVERDDNITTIVSMIRNFNSHAHVERDHKQLYQYHWRYISTHTLTWSVTQTFRKWWFPAIFQLTRSRGAWREHPLLLCLFIFISTHTLTWSVTALKFYNDKTTLNFNSHAHVERDFETVPLLCSLSISTHTLTWSVTRGLVLWLMNRLFQLTRSRGAWLYPCNG